MKNGYFDATLCVKCTWFSTSRSLVLVVILKQGAFAKNKLSNFFLLKNNQANFMLNVSFLCSAIWAADHQCHWVQVMITITFADVHSCQILFSKMSEKVIKSKPEKIILKQLVEVKKAREGQTLILTHKQWMNYREVIATLIFLKEEITMYCIGGHTRVWMLIHVLVTEWTVDSPKVCIDLRKSFHFLLAVKTFFRQ